MRTKRTRDLLGTIWVIGLLVLLIGGGAAGSIGATLALRAAGLADAEPALEVPAFVAGVAVGGMAGLAIAIGVRALPAMVREGRLGGVPRLILVCVSATALGAVLYLVPVGGLVWLSGLVLPETPTRIVAVLLSIIGLPVVGPVTFWLFSRSSRT